MRNWNFLKIRVSEIRVNQIRVNQGLGVNVLEQYILSDRYSMVHFFLLRPGARQLCALLAHGAA